MLTVLKKQLGNPKVLLLLLAVGLLNECHQTITVFLSQLQYIKAGMNHREISLAYIVINLLSLTGGFSAALCRKFGVKSVGTGLLWLASISCLLLGMVPLPLVSVAALIVLRLSFSLMQPLQMDLQNKQITGQDRATVLSINAVVLESLGIFLNLLLGSLADVQLSFAMFLGAALCGLGAVLYRCSFSRQ